MAWAPRALSIARTRLRRSHGVGKAVCLGLTKTRVESTRPKREQSKSERANASGNCRQPDLFKPLEEPDIEHQLLDAVPRGTQAQRLDIHTVDWKIGKSRNDILLVHEGTATRCDICKERLPLESLTTIQSDRSVEHSVVKIEPAFEVAVEERRRDSQAR